jgi:hypothetical protein
MAEKATSHFSIRPGLLGAGYVVVYLPERSPQMEVRQTFASEDEARRWISTEGPSWIERFPKSR